MIPDIDPHSSKNQFRERRFSWFLDLLPQLGAPDQPLKILDVGGTMDFWTPRLARLPDRPLAITLLNISQTPVSDPRFVSLAGDARDLSRFADDAFDVVHSNSVIEHVGLWRDMMAMANEVRRVAPAHFVQTPYFWFPVEPHCRTPLFHWLPHPWRLSLIMRFTLGYWPKADTVDQGMREIEDAMLLDRKMMAALFPDSQIRNETFYGLTKSIVAIRTQRGAAA